jgi:hypothetical protein
MKGVPGRSDVHLARDPADTHRNPAERVRGGLPTAIITGEDSPGYAGGPMDQIRSITRGATRSTVNFNDVNLALVEKCRDPDRGTTLFFCLGARGDSSWAATEYLVRNWRRLSGEFGDEGFVVCLGFPKTEKYE